VPAKGLTGQGYEGHYFWDGEIYVLPYVIYTDPRLAGNLLHFRWGQLDLARAHARELGHAGALFPWRKMGQSDASGEARGRSATGQGAQGVRGAGGRGSRPELLQSFAQH
jgi:trehalose/maltose hydrolase-like predicted phosphorylase